MNIELETIVSLVLGILFLFFGYRVQKVIISIVWFIIGYELSNLIAPHFFTDPTTLIIVGIVVGLVLVVIGFKLEKLALFIAVAYLVYKTLTPYISLLHLNNDITFLIQIGISLVVGALSVAYIKHILIIITSLAGANLINKTIPTLITLNSTILFIIFLVLAALGILFQFKNN